MRSNYDDVIDFSMKMKLPLPVRPGFLEREFMQFRIKCMIEELHELCEAYDKGDLPETIDAMIDLVYFVEGTAALMGVQWQRHWSEVHRSNMLKVPGKTKRGFKLDAIKPLGWTPPDHMKILGETAPWRIHVAPK